MADEKTDQSNRSPVLPEHTTAGGLDANFAPLQPLLALQRGNVKAESTLQGALKERFKHHYTLEKKTWDEMNATGYQVANFIEGRQLLRPNPFLTGQWLPYTPQSNDADTKRALNFVRFYTSNELWKWQLSNPDVIATQGVDTEAARESAAAADVIIEHYERKFFEPFITIQEALQGLCWGTYIWDIRYDDSDHSMTALKPIFAPQQISMPEMGVGNCGFCGFAGPAAAFPNPAGPISPCPQCGEMAMVDTPTGEVQSQIGVEPVQLGDLVAKLRPFPECRWDIRHRAEDSTWFMHLQRTSLTAVRRLLGPIKLGGTSTESSDLGLDIMDKLPWMGQSGGGKATTDNRRRNLYEEPVTVVEYSLGPDDIADIIIKAPEQGINGQEIPAGPLVDFFPNGLTVQGLNGLSVITGIYGEHHSKSIVSGVWHAKAVSGTGQGLTDLVEVQKRFNADDSLVHTFMRANSTPAMLVRAEALGEEDRAQYLASPEINIPVTAQNLPENIRLEDLVRPAYQPMSVPATTFQYIYERLNDFAQLTSHITDFSGGLPNVNNRTATGAQITQANSNALFTPILQIKGQVRQRIAGIVLDLYRKHFPVERYFPLQGRYGRQQGKYLSGANLSTDIRLEVVKDSELPKNSYTKREDYAVFLQLVGGIQGYKMARDSDPEFVVELERAFNFPMKAETYNQVASLCQQRLMQMKTVSDMIPDPMLTVMSITPPIAPEELGQELCAKWLAEWLTDDEGQRANPVLRAAVQLLIQLQFSNAMQMAGAVAAGMGMIAAAGAGVAPGEESGTMAKGSAGGGPPGPHDSKPNVNHPTGQKITGRPTPQGKG